MKKIKFIIFILALSSCNKYLGTVDTDYTPINEVTDIFSKVEFDTEDKDFDIGQIIYPKKVDPKLNINIQEINTVTNTDKKSVINFFNDKIYLSKNKYIYEIDKETYKNISEIKLNLSKDEHVHHIFNYNDKLYFLTNRSRKFILDSNSVSLVNDYDILTNKIPLLMEEKLILFSVFGEIYQANLNDNSILQIGNFEPKPGINLKSNTFEDSLNLFTLFNSSTLITFDKINMKHKFNYILQDLNIMSSLGIFNDLIDTPFIYNNYLYFLDHSGKIAVFDPTSAHILWELDINDTLLYYNFTEIGQLIILTLNKILIINDKGNLIYEYSHNKDSPISFSIFQEYFYLISKEGITSINLNNKFEVDFYKNKFSSNLEVYYQNRNIFLKDDKRLLILSE